MRAGAGGDVRGDAPGDVRGEARGSEAVGSTGSEPALALAYRICLKAYPNGYWKKNGYDFVQRKIAERFAGQSLILGGRPALVPPSSSSGGSSSGVGSWMMLPLPSHWFGEGPLCLSASFCDELGGPYGPARFISTDDEGKIWEKAAAFPAGFGGSEVACYSSRDCAVDGLVRRGGLIVSADVLTTTDGGGTWVTTTIPVLPVDERPVAVAFPMG